MKARKIAICILLSFALVITLIPNTIYAEEEMTVDPVTEGSVQVDEEEQSVLEDSNPKNEQEPAFEEIINSETDIVPGDQKTNSNEITKGKDDFLQVNLKGNGSEASVPLNANDIEGMPYFFFPSGKYRENAKQYIDSNSIRSGIVLGETGAIGDETVRYIFQMNADEKTIAY